MATLNPYFLPNKRGLNPYFSYMGENASNKNEQDMIDSLVKEYIQQFGLKVVYIARTPHNLDSLLSSNFEKTF